MSSASITMSFDEPVEEHPLKSSTRQLDHTESPNTTKLSLESRDQQKRHEQNGSKKCLDEKEMLKLETGILPWDESSEEKEDLRQEKENKLSLDSKEEKSEEVEEELTSKTDNSMPQVKVDYAKKL